MAQLNLSPAWDIYYQKINALFKNDALATVIYDRDNFKINIYVEDEKKAEALDQVLIHNVIFGSQELTINVIPANSEDRAPLPYGVHKRSRVTYNYPRLIWDDVFYGNPLYSYSRRYTGIYNNPLTYVVFTPSVVQYYTDSLNDINGFSSTLAQEIAKDIFVDGDGVFFCTDKVENFKEME